MHVLFLRGTHQRNQRFICPRSIWSAGTFIAESLKTVLSKRNAEIIPRFCFVCKLSLLLVCLFVCFAILC